MPILQRWVILTVIGVATSALVAQSRPDFSGAWVLVSPPDGAAQALQVRQDVATLTEAHGEEHALIHKLDGTESRNTFSSHAPNDIVIKSTGTWKDTSLVITTHATYSAGNTRQTKQVWSLGSDGQLNIEFTDRVNTPAEKTTRLVYKRAASSR